MAKIKENILIAAGTIDAKLIDGDYQPYIKIKGKTNIERVTASVLDSECAGNIYIWGEKQKLTEILQPYLTKHPSRVFIIEQKKGFVDSLVYTYLTSFQNSNLQKLLSTFNNLSEFKWPNAQKIIQAYPSPEQTVTLLMSDTPFLTHEEVDDFITHKSTNTDITLGRCRYSSLNGVLDLDFEKDKAVKNYYTFMVGEKQEDVILNGFFAGNLSSIDEKVWNLISVFHKNRTIIEGGIINFKKLKNNLRSFKSTFLTKNHQTKIEKLKTMYFLTKVFYKVVKAKPISKYNDLITILNEIKKFTDMDVGLCITNSPGSALDTDTPYEKYFYEKNFEKLTNLVNHP